MINGGDDLTAAEARWRFDGDVAAGFDAHVRRSVPFYEEGYGLVLKLSDFFVGDGSVAYDIGCATGALTRQLAERHRDQHVRVIGIDLAEAMVARARERCEGLGNVETIAADVVEMDLQRCDLIVAYYTMQFIRPAVRQLVFDKVYASLNWGGALLLFEKVRAPDARFQDTMTQLYTDFKSEQGFSDTEIIAKARSLKGVLEPFSTQGNLDLMRRAGFVDVMTVFKYLSFEGFLAIK